MTDAPRKKKHTLYECRSGEAFLERLETEVGGAAVWHPKRFVAPPALRAVVVGGSIPLGIGSPMSDVDFIAVVDQQNDLPQQPEGEGLLFFTRRNDNASIIMQCSGVEIEIIFVTMKRVLDIAAAVQSAKALPSVSDMRLISRLYCGWTLYADAELNEFLAGLRENKILAIRCTVEAYVFALQTFGDAIAALEDNRPLSAHLGRLAVEWGIKAYLSCQGKLYVGDKWLRLLRSPKMAAQEPGFASSLCAEAERLVFPPPDALLDGAESYLASVRGFLASVKKHIEVDASFRLAFRVSAQIHNP